MYAILGATGNTGKPLTLALLAAGKQVRILSRSAEKAAELTGAGAELINGDVNDVAAMTKAFTGADAAYVLLPPDWSKDDFYAYQQTITNNIAEAVKASGIKYVVSLSSVGAQLPEDTGVVYGLNYMENKLNEIEGVNVLHLRPGYFMENIFGQIQAIKQYGVMGSPVRADLPLTMIATKDIGAYAAKRLLALDFSGKSAQYLLGQREVTYTEVAGVIGAAIGKPELQYQVFPEEALKAALMGMGATANIGDRMNQFIRVANEGKLLTGVTRDAESTTPTSIEEFAQTFAYVFNMN